MMRDVEKSKAELLEQLAVLHNRMAQFEKLELEQRFLLEHTRDFIYKHDTHGIFTYISPAAEKITGYPAKEHLPHYSNYFTDNPINKKAIEHTEYALMTGKDTPPYAVEIYHKDGRRIWLEVNEQPYFEGGKVAGIIGIGRDITERKRAEERLHYRFEIEKLIANISTNFINLASDRIDHGINQVLQTIGEFLEVDRSNIFLLSPKETIIDHSYGWCAHGIEIKSQNLNSVHLAAFPWLRKKLKNFQPVHIPCTDDLPPEASPEKRMLQLQGIRSSLIVPMVYGGSLLGFLSLDSLIEKKAWIEEDLELLKILVEIFINALERKKVEEELVSIIVERQKALAKLRTLRGLIPICASCKKIRDDAGYWNQIEAYLRDHSEAEFSHSLCPDCIEKLDPDSTR